MDPVVIDLCSSPEVVDLAEPDFESVFTLTDDESLPAAALNGSDEETQRDVFSSPLAVCEKRTIRVTLTPEKTPAPGLPSPPPPPQLVPPQIPPKKRPRFAKTSATAASAGARPSRSKSVKKMTDRTETAKDMLVEVSGDAPFVEEAVAALKGLGVRAATQTEAVQDGLIIVRLARMVADTFNDEEDMFVAADLHRESEDTALAVITSDQFLDVLLDESQHKPYFDDLARLIGTPKIIYIVQGLQAIVKRHQNKHNQVVQRRARAYMEGSQSTDLSPVTKARIDPVVVSEGQTRLQVGCGINVLYSPSDSRTAEWIIDLVQDLSLARYKTRYSDHPTVKSGTDSGQCTIEALIRLARVTPTIAARIQAIYPNMAALLHALSTTGPSCLVDSGVAGTAMADSIHQALCGSGPEDLV